jgi:ribosomal protein S18 acetylase RimI-like enzyme
LVNAVIDHAAAVVEQVTLTVVADNASAIALYSAMGFERYGVEPRALKSERGYADEVLMVRYCAMRDP